MKAPLAYPRLVRTAKHIPQHPAKHPSINHTATVLSFVLGVVAIPLYFFHWSTPMASKHQPPSDREFFAHLRRSDRSIRTLQREADRESKLLKEIGYWQDILDAYPRSRPSTSRRWAHPAFAGQPPHQDTWRDELADGWNDMVWTIKEAAFTSLQILLIVVFNIIWWAFLIIVALPIVWDWFWQLPPGLQ
ncbi:MAG: hypothetical protein IPJ33_14670 [Gammaproteobacteria bacterium]|nr:hypothetical protein [Gammaproteobacteria bacterium]